MRYAVGYPADAKQPQAVGVIKDQQPPRLNLDSFAHGRKQLFAIEIICEAKPPCDCLVILGEGRLIVGVDPEDGACGVVTSAVGIFEYYLGFPSIVSLYARYRQSIISLPGTAEAAEGGALVFGRRRQEGVESREDVGAVDDILVAGEGNYATGFRNKALVCIRPAVDVHIVGVVIPDMDLRLVGEMCRCDVVGRHRKRRRGK
jgi:hypothetical protein